MGYWLNKFETAKAELEQIETPARIEGISTMRFSELEMRNLAVEIYSEILDCSVWLCSNVKMVHQIRKDAQHALVFTVQEFRHLVELNPGQRTLKQICAAKKIFPASAIVEATPCDPTDSLKDNSDVNITND